MSQIENTQEPDVYTLSGTSNSQITMSMGLKHIVLNENNVAFIRGHRLRVVSTDFSYDGICYMEGNVESINGVDVSIRVDYISGPVDSIHKSWTIGISGDPGKSIQGEKGDKGDSGETGPEGKQGPVGHLGPRGEAGKDGAPGPIGPQGPIGEIGPQGPVGPIGSTGRTGERGAQGFRGEKGEKGAQGPSGEDGKDGRDGNDGKHAPVYSAISRTSNDITKGNKVFILDKNEEGYAYTTGMRVRIARPFVHGFWMEGVVNYFLRATREINIVVDRAAGRGSFDKWVINPCGDPGRNGNSHPGLFYYRVSTDPEENSISINRGERSTRLYIGKQTSGGTDVGKLWMSGRIGSYIYLCSTSGENPFRTACQIKSIFEHENHIEMDVEELVVGNDKWEKSQFVYICF